MNVMKKSEPKVNAGTRNITEASPECTLDRRRFLELATSSSATFLLGPRFMLGATDPAYNSGERTGDPDPLSLSKWHRVDRHDGYVVGNGRMYMVAGLGLDLDLSTKSKVTSVEAPLSRIAWVIGPTYALGNLGWGWEIEAANDDGAIAWETETIVSPSPDCPFWGVECNAPTLTMNISDIIMADHPVIVRRVTFRCPAASRSGNIRLRIPVRFDPRNGGEMFSLKHDHSRASSPSLAENRLRQAFPAEGAFVTVAGQRALYQEDSTVILDADCNRRIFPPRALATGIGHPSPQVITTLQDDAFNIELGRLAPGETREIAVWLVTVSASDSGLEAEALRELNRWRARDLTEVISEAKAARPLPLLTRTDGRDDPLLHSIEASYSLATACQAHSGGVMAEPYMYPMYYVRDQYGSARLFLACGDYERAWGILGFHLGMAAFFGLQNAYDTFDVPPDPARWPRRTEAVDSRFKDAEVPSYMILEARDYLRATGDLERVKPLYPQLAFNLRVQKPSVNDLFPSQGDESYSNFEETAPRFRQEATDSSLLFIAAAEFMNELARKLGHAEDGNEFAELARRTRDATMKRLWLAGRKHFAYARDESNDPAHIDARPVLDPLLRWDWLGMGEPGDSVSQGCLNAVLQYLINPVRVVPEDQAITAGMDAGYLLHALTRAQDFRMHDAARLVLKYASAQGLYSEYYSHENGVIIPKSANLRPWESGVNATALLYYLIGLESDLLNQCVSLNPHLPPDWPGWSVRPILLPGEGMLHLRFERADADGVSLFIAREGGSMTLIFDVGLGGFEQTLVWVSKPLKVLAEQPNLARGSVSIAPGKSWTGIAKTNSRRDA
jgi:hypothetical protein